MFKKINVLIIILLASNFCKSDVKFSSDAISLHFPNEIMASGNTNFYNDNININSDYFFYNTQTLTGTFKENVIIEYEKSKLSGDLIFLNLNNKEISGKGNISLKTHGFEAVSDDLLIKDYKIAHLKNNVEIKRNGSQISSNELVYNLETDTIISTQRVKLRFE